jgi:molybdopterin converting factor small subunit
MVTVIVPAPLRSFCGGATKLEVVGATLGELLKNVDVLCPGFYTRVVEDGRVRPELAVAINGEAANYALFEALQPNAEVTIVPAISGG